MLGLALVAGAVVQVPTISRAQAPHVGRRPNVLIIVTDDQRAGNTMNVMPETRRFFRRNGTSYSRAYATTPQCCPSRASIMTGQYAHNHNVRNNAEALNLDQRSTLQRYLHDAGYFTALVGKYLNGWDVEQPPAHFDRWALLDSPPGYLDTVWNENGHVRTVTQYSTKHVADRAIDFLRWFERGDDSRPWYMYVAPFAPHGPFTPESRYEDTPLPTWHLNPAVREKDRSDKPAYVQERDVRQSAVRQERRGALRTLMSVDDMVARIRRALARWDERKRTLAVFLSDNGYLWGEHGLGVLATMAKRSPYKQSVRIPLLVRWPRHVEGGTVDHSLVATIDIVVTVLAATRTPRDPHFPLDGRSLFSRSERSELLLEYFMNKGPPPEWAAVLTRSISYIENYGNESLEPVFREFYDHEKDRWELRNLLGDRRDANDPDVTELSARLDAYRRCSGATCP